MRSLCVSWCYNRKVVSSAAQLEENIEHRQVQSTEHLVFHTSDTSMSGRASRACSSMGRQRLKDLLQTEENASDDDDQAFGSSKRKFSRDDEDEDDEESSAFEEEEDDESDASEESFDNSDDDSDYGTKRSSRKKRKATTRVVVNTRSQRKGRTAPQKSPKNGTMGKSEGEDPAKEAGMNDAEMSK